MNRSERRIHLTYAGNFGSLMTMTAAFLASISLASASEPTITAASRDIVLDCSWGYNTGVKQPLGSYKDGRSVHAVSRFTRQNPIAGKPELGSPDFIVWVDENTGEASAHEHPAGVYEDGVNPGGNVAFASGAAETEQGRMWWVLGGRAYQLPLDIARSSGLFEPHYFDIVLDNFETVDQSTAPTLSVVGQTGLLVYRYLRSTSPDAAILFQRYSVGSGTPLLETTRELGHASYVDGLGQVTIEQVWSRWDPRRRALAVTWQWFAHESSPSYIGSNPFIYTEDIGETWRLADGTPVVLPLTYATTTDPKVSPYDHLAFKQTTGWQTQDIGFAPDGSPWLTLRVGIQKDLRFFFWKQAAWESRTLSTGLDAGKPVACGATRNYLVCAYSESQQPGELLLSFSQDSGQTWSTPAVVDTVGLAPGGLLQRIGWVSFVQPADGYPDNAARFFVGYYRTIDGAEGRDFKNNIRWVRIEIGSTILITSPLEGTIYPVGTSIELSASVSGTASGSVTWTANGSVITEPWTPEVGSYTVVARVADGNGGDASDSVQVAVADSVSSVPNVVGLTLSAASTALADAGLVVGLVTEQPSATVPVGSVISQAPTAATSVTAGSAVDLVVSTGAASFTLSPTALAFGNQALKLVSNSQSITLESNGNATLPITSIAILGTNPGEFAQINDCGSSVPAAGSCAINVTFKPTGTGLKTAMVTVTAGGGAGTKDVSLSGTGVKSALTVFPTTLAFGNVARNTTSTAKTVEISNTGTVVLPITSIAIVGSNPSKFAQTNNCPALVPVASSCTVSVVFKPTGTGSKSASLKITPGGGASAKSVSLSGTGI